MITPAMTTIRPPSAHHSHAGRPVVELATAGVGDDDGAATSVGTGLGLTVSVGVEVGVGVGADVRASAVDVVM
jgi:hypothetical protein